LGFVVAAVDVDAVAAAASLGRAVAAAVVAAVRSSSEDNAAAGAAEDTASTAAPGGCTAQRGTGLVRIVVLGVADMDPKPAVAAHVGSADSGGIAVHLRCLGNILPTPFLCLAEIPTFFSGSNRCAGYSEVKDDWYATPLDR
jgi:hypothetical protein